MKKILTSLALVGLVAAGTAAFAAEEAHNAAAPTHFPINEPKEMSWSFTGPFGTYDKAQLQRGLKVYKEVCSACHSMNLVAFRTLEGLGYSEAQVKSFAAEYTIHDGPNDAGDMFDRPGKPSDHFPAPFANEEAAAASNGGAARPTCRCWPRHAVSSAASRASSSISSRSMPRAAPTTSIRC